jgi:sugar phosphate isomerase/epimerase
VIEDIIRKTQVSIPFRLLKEKYLRLVLDNRINPEIAIDGKTIDTCSSKDFLEMSSIIQKEGLSITLHGPFYDLAPGGMDTKILEASRDRLKQVFNLIPVFEPMSIVCHTGYDRERYHEVENEWLETALETWTPLIDDLRGTETTLVIENVYEKTPKMLLRLMKGLDTTKVGFCFDTGHMNVFSEKSMEDWLKALGPFLKQVHLHDNDGTSDDHWAIGAGKIDFEILFRYVEKNHLRPIITLEPHREDWIWQSLEALSKSGRFCGIISAL